MCEITGQSGPQHQMPTSMAQGSAFPSKQPSKCIGEQSARQFGYKHKGSVQKNCKFFYMLYSVNLNAYMHSVANIELVH